MLLFANIFIKFFNIFFFCIFLLYIMIMIFIFIRRDFEPLYFITHIFVFIIFSCTFNIFFFSQLLFVCIFTIVAPTAHASHYTGQCPRRLMIMVTGVCESGVSRDETASVTGQCPPPHLIMVTHHTSVDANLPPPEFIKTF